MTDRPRALVIIGAGGFGREVLDLVNALNAQEPRHEFVGFLDDGPVRYDLLDRLGVSHLGDTSRLADLDTDYIIGIGSPGPRRRIDAAAAALGRRAVTLCHPASTIGSDVLMGDGVVIAAGARLTTHILVGRHSQINLNCTVGHDVVIEDYVTVFGGVHLGGGAILETGATIGSGAVILPNVRVGRDATVGAGAVVVRDVAPGVTVVGSAARPTLGAIPPE